MGAHHHDHRHDHAGASPHAAAHALAMSPSASLFRVSALQRLAGVVVLLAILWGLVWAVIG